MIDADQRFIPRQGERLARGDADQQRSDQARAVDDADRAQILSAHVRQRQRFINQRRDTFAMRARRHFGHHAAEGPMQIELAGHDVGQNNAPIGDDRRRRFIARRFNAEN